MYIVLPRRDVVSGRREAAAGNNTQKNTNPGSGGQT
jgi:hypothetical protein